MVVKEGGFEKRGHMQQWKRNLVVMSIAQFLTMTAFQSYMPFIAYYVQELGPPPMRRH
jgi:hypothetical protein